jgi:alpha-tubulin suppressor-like RCC1 family protein
LSCWGNNGSGQLGAATAATGGQQTEVTGGPWQSVATGDYQTCGIQSDSTLWCWGDNTNGQLGNGNTVSSVTPVQVTGTGWSRVSTSFLHTCALKQDGTLWCWGLNGNLQLADASVGYRMLPEQVSGSNWSQVATGLYHTCAIKQDGSLWCWGGNMSGQLGNSSVPVQPNGATSDPVQVAGTWVSVAAGESHTCGIMPDQTLWCWGDNSQGQLGTANETSEREPVAIAVPGHAWAQVATGVTHTCALATDGSLWCWGDNSNGQLGIGSNEWRQSPSRVAQ